MADNSELDKMRLAAMMNKSPATGGLKATNTVTPSFSMNTPIEQAYSRWKQDNSIAAKLLRGEQMSGEDIAKDLSYQLQDATQHPENFLGTIKAVGNLNLVPRIAKETLKGPETQTLQSFMNQVKQIPGVTKEGLKSAAASLQYIKPDTKMTKAEFEAYLKPSRYQKVDLGTKHTEDVMEHLYNEAHEAITTNDVFNKMGIPANLRSYADDMINNQIYMGELPESVQTAFRSRGFNTEMDVHNAWFDTRDTMVHDYANDLLENGGFGETEKYPPEGYRYKQYQRLTPENANAGYFEFGVTHPAQKAAYRHYKGEGDPAGLIGHVRGTHITEPTNVATGSKNWLKAEPGSTVVEEFQADAQKNADQIEHLHQVHGTLAKAAIQDALEKGSHTVYIPTSRVIGSVRGSPGGEYAPIYDTAVVKEAIGPLQHIPNVKITPPKETPYSYPWSNDSVADIHNVIGIPPQQHESAKIFLSAPTGGKERLMNRSQSLLNQIDADQAAIDVYNNAERTGQIFHGGAANIDDYIKSVSKNKAKYDAHQNFLKWIDEKFPETPGNNDRYEQGQSFNEALNVIAEKRRNEIAAMKNNPDEMPFYKIEFSPEAIEHILKGPGQTAPGYKQGGTIHQDKMNYAVHMAGGGQPNNKFSYASGLADLAGLDEEYYNANTIPLQHFDKSTEHNGPADAMRHMLFQAQITKNHSPTLAKIISQGHERLLDWGQPDAEQAMDFHNDALGREIGAKAKSIDEMTQMAKDAIMSGRAKVIGHDLPGKYYKLGGNVKNVSTNTGNHGNIALTTAQIRANLLRKKHG